MHTVNALLWLFGSLDFNVNGFEIPAYATLYFGKHSRIQVVIFRRNYRTTDLDSKKNGFASSEIVFHYFDVFTKQGKKMTKDFCVVVLCLRAIISLANIQSLFADTETLLALSRSVITP